MNKKDNAMTEKLVTTEIDGAVGTITIRRPKALNALNAAVIAELFEAATALVEDPSVRVIAITGEGDRAFVAGADITEFVGASPADAMAIALRIKKVTDLLAASPKPVVAVVNGFCLGGGFELALACDIRIASPDAQFSLPETGLGLIPGAGGTQRLPRIIGLGRALDLLLTGDRIDAAEAYRVGLVTRLARDRDSLLEEAVALAGRIAARAPAATRYVKEAAIASMELSLPAGLALERSLFALLTATADTAEATRAFKEKRAPKFTGE